MSFAILLPGRYLGQTWMIIKAMICFQICICGSNIFSMWHVPTSGICCLTCQWPSLSLWHYREHHACYMFCEGRHEEPSCPKCTQESEEKFKTISIIKGVHQLASVHSSYTHVLAIFKLSISHPKWLTYHMWADWLETMLLSQKL